MSNIIRDPAYVVGVLVLAGVIALSVVLGDGSSSAAVPPHVAASPSAPTAVAPPEVATPTPLDARRASDLEKDQAALGDYRLKTGGYPTSEGLFVEFCHYGFEPGCSLISFSKEISGGDGIRQYWYRSDGKEFTLYAESETASPNGRCPAEQPPQFASAPALCAAGPDEGR